MVANVEDPSTLTHLIAGALRLRTEEKQELLEEVDVAKRLRRLSEILARELEVVAIGSKIQSQVQSELDKGQREYSCASSSRRSRRSSARPTRCRRRRTSCASSSTAIELPEEVRKQVDRELARLERLQPAMAEYGVVRSYLEWIASLPWDKSTEDNLDLGHARRGARRGPLRHRAGQGPDPRVPRRPLAEAATRAAVDPVLRRSAGRRQDLARPLDRARAGPQVRADQRRRGPRRGGDPRPPPHVHRRDARGDHPRAPRRGRQQPAADDRRDRQDGRRLPRRPVERDARGARPRAEPTASATTTSTCRSISRT